jgi:hypothetical protein
MGRKRRLKQTRGGAAPIASGHVPPTWGDDALSAFFDVARDRVHSSFHHLPLLYRPLRFIDDAFLALIDGWKDPESVLATSFVYRAHAAYRAAAQLALAGQLPEAYMVTRGCLENALYANRVDNQTEIWNAWMNRGQGDEALRRCKKEFSGAKLFDSLAVRDEQLSRIAKGLYERTIEFGAHPNETATGTLMEVEDAADGGLNMYHSYISDDGLPFQLCVRSVRQVGLIVLDVFTLIFPSRSAAVHLQDRIAPWKVGA